jgi:hypothetical protein
MDSTLAQEIYAAVKHLNTQDQRLVLTLVKRLLRPQGMPGYLAVQYAREINFPKEDLAEIQKAIEEAHEEGMLEEWEIIEQRTNFDWPNNANE